MRKLLLATAALLSLVSTTFAQVNEEKKFNIGITAGGGLGKMLETNTSYEGKMVGTFHGGVVVDYYLFLYSSIESGLIFQRNGVKYEQDLISKKVNTNYLEIPILYNFGSTSQNVSFNIQAGIYVGYGIGGKVKFDSKIDDVKIWPNSVYGSDLLYYTQKEYNELANSQRTNISDGYHDSSEDIDAFAEDGLKRLDIGWQAGISFTTSQKFRISFGIKSGFVNLYKDIDYLESCTAHNFNAYGALTYYLK